MIVQHDKSVQNNSWWLSNIRNSYMTGEDSEWQVNEYNKMVKSITLDDIKAAAAKYFDLNNYVVVTLRPEDGAVGTAD
jgi:zinc protease